MTNPTNFIDVSVGRESIGSDPLGIGAKRNETKRKRTAPTSIIFRSFVVERIGCGANRSIGGQSWVAQRVNFGAVFCETGDLRGTKTRNTPRRDDITGLVDLTDQFDANHSFAIY